MLRYLCTFLFLAIAIPLSASHVLGVDMSYTNIGEGRYLIEARLETYCAAGGSLSSISVRYHCPITGFDTFFLVGSSPNYVWADQQMGYPCLDTIACCAWPPCSVVELDVHRRVYSDTIDLSSLPSCANGKLIMEYGLRPSGVNYLSQPSMSSLIDFNPASENSSPSMLNTFIPHRLNSGSTYHFNVRQYDADGDSLSYALDTAVSNYNPVTGILYVQYDTANGFSALNPMSGLTLNASSGEVELTPTIPTGYTYAVYALSWRVDQWDAETGEWKGSQNRETTLQVEPDSTNANPVIDSVLVGGNVVPGNQAFIQSCTGEEIDVRFYVSDPDSLDSLRGKLIYDSLSLDLTVTQDSADPFLFVVSGTAILPSETSRLVTLRIDDDHCPKRGITTVTIELNTPCVNLDTLTLCAGDSQAVDFFVDSLVTWQSIAGDPINATTLSCLGAGCLSAFLKPSQTTTYVATQWKVGGTSFIDTFTVQVVSFPSLVFEESGPACDDLPFGLSVATSPGTPFQVIWEDASNILLNDSVDSTIVLADLPGTYLIPLFVAVTEECIIQDTYELEVHARPYFTSTGFYSQSCKGDTFQLHPTGADHFTWTPSVGLTDTIDSPMCVLFGPQTYTVTGYNQFGCFETDEVSFDPKDNGLQLLADFSENPNVQEARAELYRYQPLSDTLELLDSGQLDVTGAWFAPLFFPRHYLRIVPDTIAFPDHYLPTYYSEHFTIQSAAKLMTDYCDTLDLEQEIIIGPLLSGFSSVGGTVRRPITNDPAKVVHVILTDALGSPLKWQATDSTGYFRFTDLSEGDYRFFVDQWGLDNTVAPSISLGPQASVDSLWFTIYPDSLVLHPWPLGMEDVTEQLNLFPNPADKVVTVDLGRLAAMIEVYDLFGRRIHASKIQGRWSVSTASWPAGVYLFRLEQRGAIRTERVVIAH